MTSLSLGPSGEFAAQIEMGGWQAEGLGEEVYAAIEAVRQEGGEMTGVSFGEQGAYIVRYRVPAKGNSFSFDQPAAADARRAWGGGGKSIKF